MSRFVAIALTAAICLPLGAVLQRSASAERRKNSLPGDVAVRHRRLTGSVTHDVEPIAGHPNLALAEAALREAAVAIAASQQVSEPMWSDSTGRARMTRDAIVHAKERTERTAQWVRAGMERR